MATKVQKLLSKIPSAVRLTSPCAVQFGKAPAEGEAQKGRRFRMDPAYSGAPVRTMWGRMIVDLAGMETPAGRMAILLEHDPAQRAGVADKLDKGEESLSIEGELLDNPVAQGIEQDAAKGFPFQASIGFDILRTEYLEDGDEKTVNGQAFAGPGVVVTKSALRETSVVALGADGSTDTSIFARFSSGAEPLEVDMDPEQFAREHPEAVEAWKREGAGEARAELGSMLKELPEEAPFVAEQFAAGAGPAEIKAAAKLAAKKREELDQEREKLKKAEAELARLKRQPGVGFSAQEDDQVGSGDGDTPDGLPVDEVEAKQRWAKDPSLRAEFGGRESAYLAWLRRQRG